MINNLVAQKKVNLPYYVEEKIEFGPIIKSMKRLQK